MPGAGGDHPPPPAVPGRRKRVGLAGQPHPLRPAGLDIRRPG